MRVNNCYRSLEQWLLNHHLTFVQQAVQWPGWISTGSHPRHRKNLKHLIIIGSLLAVPAEAEGWEGPWRARAEHSLGFGPCSQPTAASLALPTTYLKHYKKQRSRYRESGGATKSH